MRSKNTLGNSRFPISRERVASSHPVATRPNIMPKEQDKMVAVEAKLRPAEQLRKPE